MRKRAGSVPFYICVMQRLKEEAFKSRRYISCRRKDTFQSIIIIHKHGACMTNSFYKDIRKTTIFFIRFSLKPLNLKSSVIF